MRNINVSNQTTWKRFFQDAVLELDPRIFEERLEAARKAIEDRLLEMNSAGHADPLELEELTYAQHTVSFLQREQHHIS